MKMSGSELSIDMMVDMRYIKIHKLYALPLFYSHT